MQATRGKVGRRGLGSAGGMMAKRNLLLAAGLILVVAVLVSWLAGRPSVPVVQQAPREPVPVDVATGIPAGSMAPAQGPDASQAAPGAPADPSASNATPELSATELPSPVPSEDPPAVPELEALPTLPGQPAGEELLRVPLDPVAPADDRPEIERVPELSTTPGSAEELVDATAPGQGNTSTR